VGELEIEPLLCRVGREHDVGLLLELLHLAAATVLVEVAVHLRDVVLGENLVAKVLEGVRVLGEDENLLVRVLAEDPADELFENLGLRVGLDGLGLPPELFDPVKFRLYLVRVLRDCDRL